MFLKSLGLEHFRCHTGLEMTFGPGLHVLVGPNAAGKTTILEAVYVLVVTRSHRCSNDRDLIQWGAPWARVRGSFETAGGRDLSLRVTFQQRQQHSAATTGAGRKTVEVNGVPRRRLTDIIGQVAAVMFGPDDLSLIKGAPGLRRRFLNAAISQVDPVYLADLIRYRQALRQRNEALRAIASGTLAPQVLSAWDPQLVESGARVSLRRARFTAALAPHLKRAHRDLVGEDQGIDVQYCGDLARAVDLDGKRAVMQQLLTGAVQRDLALGRTTRGPHRDDLELSLAGRSLRVFGSQGQQRTAALSLTLAEALVISDLRGEPPIILLDDCLSELDDDRARRLLRLTTSFTQLIVTTASRSRVLDSYDGPLRVIEVGHGTAIPLLDRGDHP